MIDIHCHILPCLDDGARNMEEAVEMARIAYSEGITKIVATPHYIEDEICPSRYEINHKIKELQVVLKSENIEIEILTGNEVYLTNFLPLHIKRGNVTTINNTQYILIEFPMFNIPIYTEDVIYNLKLVGITPIIAHPERYRYVIENPNILIKYIDMGALCQINSGSITGKFGKEALKTSKVLISHDMVHFVASDGHASRIRAPKLKRAYEKVMDLYGKEKSEELFKINPQKIIEGKDIDMEEPKKIGQKNKITSFFNSLI